MTLHYRCALFHQNSVEGRLQWCWCKEVVGRKVQRGRGAGEERVSEVRITVSQSLPRCVLAINSILATAVCGGVFDLEQQPASAVSKLTISR